MKLFTLVFLITLFLSFGITNADGITISNFDGGWDNGTKVVTGRPVTWTLRMDSRPIVLFCFTNGFRVFISSDGTVGGLLDPGPGFTPITYSTLYPFYQYAGTYSVQEFGVDGIGADTIGIGTPGPFSGNFPQIYEDVWTITTQVENNAIGNYLCLDSSYTPPGGVWLWTDGFSQNYYPSWDGPHCYLIEPCCQQRGDVIGDPLVLIDDLTLLANYIFKSGPPPDCLKAGDVIVDDIILVNDLVFLVNYIFKGGDAPPPCD